MGEVRKVITKEQRERNAAMLDEVRTKLQKILGRKSGRVYDQTIIDTALTDFYQFNECEKPTWRYLQCLLHNAWMNENDCYHRKNSKKDYIDNLDDSDVVDGVDTDDDIGDTEYITSEGDFNVDDDGEVYYNTSIADNIADNNKNVLQELIDEEEIYNPLYSAIDRLPDIEKTVLKSYFWDEAEYRVIAKKYNLTIGEVFAIVKTAIAMLKAVLTESKIETKYKIVNNIRLVTDHTLFNDFVTAEKIIKKKKQKTKKLRNRNACLFNLAA